MKMKSPTKAIKLEPLQQPPERVPLIERDENSRGAVNVTAAGLDYIRYLAAEFCTQQFIASKLGISFATLTKLLGNAAQEPMSPTRAAWESGRAQLETEINRAHLAHLRAGNPVTPMFIAKTEFGKRESGDPTTNINIGSNNKIAYLPPGIDPELVSRLAEEAAKSGVLLLPRAYKDHADFLREKGMAEPDDARDAKTIVADKRKRGVPDAEILAYLKRHGKDDARTMKDVTPPKEEEKANAK